MDVEIILPPGADVTRQLDHGLVTLTEAISQVAPDTVAHGFLGGEFGYGAEYNNAVFEMRPFYWGDCDCGWDETEDEWCNTHDHHDDCYQSELAKMKIQAGWTQKDFGWLEPPAAWSYDKATAEEGAIYKHLCEKHGLSYPNGCAIHCTCDYAPAWHAFVAAHNGGHKPTCSLELPNFRHKASGFEVRWYKYIGRGMETSDVKADLHALFAECLSSLPATPSTPGR